VDTPEANNGKRRNVNSGFWTEQPATFSLGLLVTQNARLRGREHESC